ELGSVLLVLNADVGGKRVALVVQQTDALVGASSHGGCTVDRNRSCHGDENDDGGSAFDLPYFRHEDYSWGASRRRGYWRGWGRSLNREEDASAGCPNILFGLRGRPDRHGRNHCGGWGRENPNAARTAHSWHERDVASRNDVWRQFQLRRDRYRAILGFF